MPQPQSDAKQKKQAVWYLGIILCLEKLRRKNLNPQSIALVSPTKAAPQHTSSLPTIAHTPSPTNQSAPSNLQGSQEENTSNHSNKTQLITLAEQIHKDGQAYALYSVLDSLSSSYSMFKYFFDVTINSTQDDMHHAMLTPEGIAVISAEVLFLVGFSFLAYCFDREGKGTFKKQLSNAWPYFRDAMKALKNAYKGFRSVIMAMHLLGVSGAHLLMLPVGLALGILAVGNRFLIRRITEARKSMMDANAALLQILISTVFLSQSAVCSGLGKIQMQTPFEQKIGYVYSALGGVIDGLYLYAGALTLSILAPYLLIPMVALSAFYTLSCVITRLYEEYDFQLRLEVTQTQCRLAIYTKRIQSIFSQLSYPNASDTSCLNIPLLKSELAIAIAQLITDRDLLKKQTASSYFVAVLLGIKNGLYAYGALSSVVFLAATILALSGLAFPPLLIVIFISTGAVFMLGFLIHALSVHHQHRQKNDSTDDAPAFQPLIDMKLEMAPNSEERLNEQTSKQSNLTAGGLGFFSPKIKTQAELDQSLHAALSVTPCPSYKFQEWFEVIRSLFSGMSKGQKFIDFSCNPLQEVGPASHYQDTPVMFVLGSLSALLFGINFACRALARGFGRSPNNGGLVDAAKSSPDLSQEGQGEGPESPEPSPPSSPRPSSAPPTSTPSSPSISPLLCASPSPLARAASEPDLHRRQEPCLI